MKRVYVAGKYDDQVVSDIMDFVIDGGHQLALDWRRYEVEKPYLDHRVNGPIAMDMARMAAGCDVFILVAHPRMYGALVELGAALASPLDKRIVMYLHEDVDFRESIFMAHPNVSLATTYEDLREALAG